MSDLSDVGRTSVNSLHEDIMEAVAKRAIGYAATETVEEYAVVDGSLELVKRKVTVKDVPPDIAAAKLIIDGNEIDALTDEQLAAEKRRLLSELFAEQAASKSNAKNDNKNNNKH